MVHSILHLDSESTWRGGENQMRLLLENARNREWSWHLAAPPGSQAIERLKAVAQTIPTAMRGLRQIKASALLADYVRQHRIGLIDCQTSQAHQLGLLIKMRVPAVKLVVHRRVDYRPGASWFNRKKYLSPRVDRYIAISGAIGRILEDYGVPGSRISVVRSAVDAGPFQSLDRAAAKRKLAAELGFDPNTVVIGNVAYITEQKGHATLIRALARVKKEGKGRRFFCFIAGDGHLRQECEALAQSLGLNDSELRFLGIRSDVPQLLGASDIFALSSNDEGLGTSLLDAVHAGATLVASEVGGIPEIILPGKTGCLAPVRNDTIFAEQLLKLIDNEALRRELAAAAKEHAARNFSLESMVEGNLKVYRELLSR